MGKADWRGIKGSYLTWQGSPSSRPWGQVGTKWRRGGGGCWGSASEYLVRPRARPPRSGAGRGLAPGAQGDGGLSAAPASPAAPLPLRSRDRDAEKRSGTAAQTANGAAKGSLRSPE